MFGVRILFSMDACGLFSQCMLAIIPLSGGVTDVQLPEPAWRLSGAFFFSWLSYTCRGRVCSLAVGVESPRSISELQCEVDGIGALPLGEEPLSIPPLEQSTGACALLYCVAPTMGFTKYAAVGTAPWPCFSY